MIRLSEWLTDLAENHRVDLVDGEICIIPIKDDKDE